MRTGRLHSAAASPQPDRFVVLSQAQRHTPGPPDSGFPDPEFDLNAALSRFAPELRLHPDDPHRPVSVPWYLGRTRLRRWRGLFRPDDDILPVGRVTPERLALAAREEEGRPAGNSGSLYLDIPRGPRERDTRRGFRPTGGTVEAPCYVNARAAPDDPTAFDIQYWFFYAFNGREGRHITHEGDWEHVTVRISNAREPSLLSAYISAHGTESGVWAMPARVSPPQFLGSRPELRLAPSGRPIIYSALGSHACYPGPGAFARGRIKSRDRTADGGPVWDTAHDLVLVEINGRRPAGDEDEHRWLDYPGRWGAIRKLAWPFATSGPLGPSHQASWRAEPPPVTTNRSGNGGRRVTRERVDPP